MVHFRRDVFFTAYGCGVPDVLNKFLLMEYS